MPDFQLQAGSLVAIPPQTSSLKPSRDFTRSNGEEGLSFPGVKADMTVNGFIGLVPLKARQRDLTSLLLVCSVPVLVHPLENQHLEIEGGCYVEGHMEGECYETIENGSMLNRFSELNIKYSGFLPLQKKGLI